MIGVPRRRHWFLLGVIAGMALFPWAAGMPYPAAGRKLADRSIAAAQYVKREAIPALDRAVTRVRERWLSRGIDEDEDGSTDEFGEPAGYSEDSEVSFNDRNEVFDAQPKP
jgi:hypothetical protein